MGFVISLFSGQAGLDVEAAVERLFAVAKEAGCFVRAPKDNVHVTMWCLYMIFPDSTRFFAPSEGGMLQCF